jgi:hypothetical protein
VSRRGSIASGLLAITLVVIAIQLFGRRDKESSVVASASTGASTSTSTVASTTAHEGEREVVANLDAGKASAVSAKWGSRRGELGRNRPTEGNPEGPMSFATAGKDLLVLDQVNGRMVRYGADGKVKGTSTIANTVQDVAVAKDGTVALLDRLGEKTVTLTDGSGRRVGSLSLGTNDPGLLTGVFVDGNTVYVEEGHGGLTGIGTTDGQPLSSPSTLGGRPTKDGALLVTGTLAASEGKLTVNAIDRRTGTLRFARQVQMPRPSSFIVLLDSDNAGVVYTGVAAGQPESATIACLDPTDGHVLGRVILQMSSDPEETFRDFAVEADGTIVHAVRTADGIDYETATCP